MAIALLGMRSGTGTYPMRVEAGQGESLPVETFPFSQSMRLTSWCALKEERAEEETIQKVLEINRSLA